MPWPEAFAVVHELQVRWVSTALPSAQATGIDAGSIVGGASPAHPNE